jgi:hypothetical protein
MDLPVIIPCFFHNAETIGNMETEEILGVELDVKDEDYDIQEVQFYSISFILKHPEKEQTMIGANGDEFRSPWPLKKVIKAINQ